MNYLKYILFLLLFNSIPSYGQARQMPGLSPKGNFLIHNAFIHVVAHDPIENGWVLINNGLITNIGTGVPPISLKETCEVFNANGQHLSPGLVAMDTRLGIKEVGQVRITHDEDEYGSINPEARAVIAVNPDSDHLPVARAEGILIAQVMPTGGRISGRPGTIRLNGWTWEEMAIKVQDGLAINWPSSRADDGKAIRSSYEKQIREIDDFFQKARDYANVRIHDESFPPNLQFESMQTTINGESPIWIFANDAGQIETAVLWAVKHKMKPVIIGGRRSDHVAELLEKNNVPVVLQGGHDMPRNRHSSVDEGYTIGQRLHEANVQFCIATDFRYPGHERWLAHQAATQVAYGLPYNIGLASITLNPCQILGIDDKYGSIEVGKSATFILTDGDPLEITSRTTFAMIDGKYCDLTSRHTEMRDKYRERLKRKSK